MIRELQPVYGLLFHHINIDHVRNGFNAKIAHLRQDGGTSTEIKAAQALQRSVINHALEHNELHQRDDKSKAIEGDMREITKTLQAQGLSGAEVHEKKYIKLSQERRRLVPIYEGRTSLSSNWNIIKDIFNDNLLTQDGTDEQHNRLIYRG